MINVYQLLKDASMRWPDLPAVHDESGTLTFMQLYEEAEFLRLELVKRGIVSGQGVGVMARNGRNFISGIFAVAGCGAVVMPMSHQLKSAEIEQVLKEAPLHYIMDDYSGINPTLRENNEIRMPTGSFRLAPAGRKLSDTFCPHVPGAAFIRFTSGTTGKSKGVIVSHQSVIERIEAANKALCLGPGDTVVWVLPMAYHFLVSIVLYIRFGVAIAVCRDFLAQTVMDMTNQYHGTLLYASPMHIRLLGNDKSGKDLPSLKRVISTSSGISTEICEAFRKRFGIAISQAYGIIEIGLPMINMIMSAEQPDSVGKALPDYEVAILDETGNVLPDGQTGHLAIRGPGMFDAYLSPPRSRSEVLRNGWFYTADFAFITKEGLIKIKGREKSMINVSGNKVFAEEVEAVLDSHPAIKASRISGVTHPLMGEIIEAEIILHDKSHVEAEELLRYCRQKLSTYKLPQRIKYVSHLPMTGSGKIARSTA